MSKVKLNPSQKALKRGNINLINALMNSPVGSSIELFRGDFSFTVELEATEAGESSLDLYQPIMLRG